MSTTEHHSAPVGATSATGPGAAPSGPVVPLTEQLTLTVADAAELCQVSRSTVRRWIERGLPTIPHMAETRIYRPHLDRFLGGEVAA